MATLIKNQKEEKKDKAENSNGNVVIVTCPGDSNVFLLAYKAATALEKQGYGKFVKLAGEKFQEKDLQRLNDVKEQAEQWVLIEECTKGCGKKVLGSAGIEADKHFVVTSLGIERGEQNRLYERGARTDSINSQEHA